MSRYQITSSSGVDDAGYESQADAPVLFEGTVTEVDRGNPIVSRRWRIAAKHEAFGVEGERTYIGSELGAKRAAAQIAKKAGHGWTPVTLDSERD